MIFYRYVSLPEGNYCEEKHLQIIILTSSRASAHPLSANESSQLRCHPNLCGPSHSEQCLPKELGETFPVFMVASHRNAINQDPPGVVEALS